MKKKYGSQNFTPLTVVPLNIPCLQFMATGTIRSLSSANRALNLSRYGSLHVVPSGQMTKSPVAESEKGLRYDRNYVCRRIEKNICPLISVNEMILSSKTEILCFSIMKNEHGTYLSRGVVSCELHQRHGLGSEQQQEWVRASGRGERHYK